MNINIKNKIINNHTVELDLINGIVTIDNIHIAKIEDMEISDEYKDDIQTYDDKLNLFKKLVFKDNFTVVVDVYETSYFNAEGMIIRAQNDAFTIFELYSKRVACNPFSFSHPQYNKSTKGT